MNAELPKHISLKVTEILKILVVKVSAHFSYNKLKLFFLLLTTMQPQEFPKMTSKRSDSEFVQKGFLQLLEVHPETEKVSEK